MRSVAPLTSHIAAFARCCCLAAVFLPPLVAVRGGRSRKQSERTSHVPFPLPGVAPGPNETDQAIAQSSRLASGEAIPRCLL